MFLEGRERDIRGGDEGSRESWGNWGCRKCRAEVVAQRGPQGCGHPLRPDHGHPCGHPLLGPEIDPAATPEACGHPFKQPAEHMRPPPAATSLSCQPKHAATHPLRPSPWQCLLAYSHSKPHGHAHDKATKCAAFLYREREGKFKQF